MRRDWSNVYCSLSPGIYFHYNCIISLMTIMKKTKRSNIKGRFINESIVTVQIVNGYIRGKKSQALVTIVMFDPAVLTV